MSIITTTKSFILGLFQKTHPHGMHDSYSIVRDAYVIPQPVAAEQPIAADRGFVEVRPDDVRPGDVILQRVRRP